jgi:hypothetical protein
MVYNASMTNVSAPVELTISMLEVLFRDRDLSDNKGHLLPDGQYLSNSDLRLLFESYTQ